MAPRASRISFCAALDGVAAVSRASTCFRRCAISFSDRDGGEGRSAASPCVPAASGTACGSGSGPAVSSRAAGAESSPTDGADSSLTPTSLDRTFPFGRRPAFVSSGSLVLSVLSSASSPRPSGSGIFALGKRPRRRRNAGGSCSSWRSVPSPAAGGAPSSRSPAADSSPGCGFRRPGERTGGEQFADLLQGTVGALDHGAGLPGGGLGCRDQGGGISRLLAPPGRRRLRGGPRRARAGCRGRALGAVRCSRRSWCPPRSHLAASCRVASAVACASGGGASFSRDGNGSAARPPASFLSTKGFGFARCRASVRSQ